MLMRIDGVTQPDAAANAENLHLISQILPVKP
jgi:hypothetical protein